MQLSPLTTLLHPPRCHAASISALELSAPTPPLAPSSGTSAVPLPNEGRSGENDSESSLLAKGKRKVLGLGKKKAAGDRAASDHEEDQMATPTASPPAMPASKPIDMPPPAGVPKRPVSPFASPPLDHRVSPRSSPRMRPALGASPNRRSLYRSSSPGMQSLASSQIFERNVQESTLPGELSPAIPSHIQTEDHIPPVLEASSLAITDDHLNPDEVEIVMHSAHQPAAAAVTGSVTDSLYAPSQDDVSPPPEPASVEAPSMSNSNYGSLDANDVRRLSFISFADVVQAEHVETDRDAIQAMGLSTTTTNRSPSPVRSPTSSHGVSGASPPRSRAISEKGAEAMSARCIPRSAAPGPGSPTMAALAHDAGSSPPLSTSAELQIETMRQALRKTGSGDLGGARPGSQPPSAVSLEEGSADVPPFDKSF